MTKQFRIPPRYKARNDSINEFLKENREYEYLAYLNSMELYELVRKGTVVVLDSEKYRSLAVSQREYCKKKNRCMRVQEFREILERKARGLPGLCIFSKGDIVKDPIRMFDCCLKTGYNYVSELVYKGVIIGAPKRAQEWYNQKNRKKRSRKMDVYCLKSDFSEKGDKVPYSEIHETVSETLRKYSEDGT